MKGTGVLEPDCDSELGRDQQQMASDRIKMWATEVSLTCEEARIEDNHSSGSIHSPALLHKISIALFHSY